MIQILHQQKLEQLKQRNILPNTVFHGNARDTIPLMRDLLKSLFPHMGRIYKEKKTEKINSKVIAFPVFHSNTHTELMVSDFGYHSRTILPKMLSELAMTRNILTKQHKVVVLHGVDVLPKETQYVLRGNFEMIMRNCRVILMISNLHRLIEPLQSRCLVIGVPRSPDLVLQDLVKQNNPDYQLYENMVDSIMDKLDKITFPDLTKELYALMVKDVAFANILKRVIYYAHKNESKHFSKILELAASYDYQINNSSRNFIHLQTFFAELKALY